MMLARRGFLGGLGALLAAPAIIRTPGLLMPVKAVPARPLLTLTLDDYANRIFGPAMHALHQKMMEDMIVFGGYAFRMNGGDLPEHVPFGEFLAGPPHIPGVTAVWRSDA